MDAKRSGEWIWVLKLNFNNLVKFKNTKNKFLLISFFVSLKHDLPTSEDKRKERLSLNLIVYNLDQRSWKRWTSWVDLKFFACVK